MRKEKRREHVPVARGELVDIVVVVALPLQTLVKEGFELLEVGSGRRVGDREFADGITQTRFVDGGHGHYGNQDDRVLHFGIGSACEADVVVTWPDADLSAESFTVGGGYRYRVKQGGKVSITTP